MILSLQTRFLNYISFYDLNFTLVKKIKVCRGWHNVINEGMLWKAYVENQVKNNKMWAGLAKRRGWSKFLFRGCQEGIILLVYFNSFLLNSLSLSP